MLGLQSPMAPASPGTRRWRLYAEEHSEAESKYGVMGAPRIVTRQRVTQAQLDASHALRWRMTREEQLLWRHLRANRLHGFHFRRQQIVQGFFADFYCHAAYLVVEVDGPIHDRHQQYDAERDQIFRSRGLRVLRIRNDEIRADLVEVLQRIAAACESAIIHAPGEKGIDLIAASTALARACRSRRRPRT